jgi:hypothetical protein
MLNLAGFKNLRGLLMLLQQKVFSPQSGLIKKATASIAKPTNFAVQICNPQSLVHRRISLPSNIKNDKLGDDT